MKKEKKVWALTLLAFWSLSPNEINAQHADSVRQLNEVVVTATRAEQPILETPRSVTVINSGVIETSPYQSVGELLARQPGLFVVGATQTPGTNQSAFLRGANSNQVVVLIDGTRITDPSTPGATIDLAELSLANVERIEILRGAHSTLYGGAAVGGVINIITRKGRKAGWSGNAGATAGTLGDRSFTHSESVAAGYVFRNGFSLNGSVYHQGGNGINATEAPPSPGDYVTADRDGFEKTDVQFGGGYVGDGWDVSVSFKRTDQRADIDDRVFDDDDNAYLDFARNWGNYVIERSVTPRWKLVLNGSVSSSVRESVNDSSRVSTSGEYDGTFLSASYRGKLFSQDVTMRYSSSGFDAVVGGAYYGEKMGFETYYFSNAFGFPYEQTVNYDSINSHTNTFSAFAHATREWDRFAVTAGTRISHHSRFGSNMTAELSPSFRLDDLIVFVSFSTGFNPPSLYQLDDPTQGFGAFATRGNRQLEPEVSRSFEAGVKKEFTDGSYLTLSAFDSRTRNSIEYVYLWNGETPRDEITYSDYAGDRYLNVSTLDVRGLELTGHGAFGKFYVSGNVTLLDDPEIRFSAGDIDVAQTGGNHVQLYNYGAFADRERRKAEASRRPNFTANAEAGVKLGRWTVSSAVRRTGERLDVTYDGSLGPYGALASLPVDAFTLLDAAVRFDAGTHWSAVARVENVTGERYREILGFATRGRSAMLRVAYRF